MKAQEPISLLIIDTTPRFTNTISQYLLTLWSETQIFPYLFNVDQRIQPGKPEITAISEFLTATHLGNHSKFNTCIIVSDGDHAKIEILDSELAKADISRILIVANEAPFLCADNKGKESSPKLMKQFQYFQDRRLPALLAAESLATDFFWQLDVLLPALKDPFKIYAGEMQHTTDIDNSAVEIAIFNKVGQEMVVQQLFQTLESNSWSVNNRPAHLTIIGDFLKLKLPIRPGQLNSRFNVLGRLPQTKVKSILNRCSVIYVPEDANTTSTLHELSPEFYQAIEFGKPILYHGKQDCRSVAILDRYKLGTSCGIKATSQELFSKLDQLLAQETNKRDFKQRIELIDSTRAYNKELLVTSLGIEKELLLPKICSNASTT